MSESFFPADVNCYSLIVVVVDVVGALVTTS